MTEKIKIYDQEISKGENRTIGDVTHPVRSKSSGVVIGKSLLPLVNKGDALFHIGCFESAQSVVERVEKIQDEFELEDRVDEIR